jgi:alginate O-acetyltransferase complex protein AlgI
MLFHSGVFLFGFLPITLLAYFLAGKVSLRGAFALLAFASLVFYAWWNYVFVVLVLGSVAFNYVGGFAISKMLRKGRISSARVVTGAMIAADLLVLGYFKYLVFFAGEANAWFGTNWEVGRIILPIGISFYTFTQIAYLVDTLQGKVRERSLLSYLLFVTYFPHLVAGPVLHHAEMMPQFRLRENLVPQSENLARGLTFLAFGLFKKVVLADGCAPIANAAFGAAQGGIPSGEAWLGSIAYSLQIYFDFSGYSDMAVGISLLFNIKLPINFYSPYRARNIIDFWRCWHMTLSRFLRDYLYVPLGGNRKGNVRRYVNLFATMVLGGLWHGANWTFLVWGALHGTFLTVNHLWRVYFGPRDTEPRYGLASIFYHALTLLAVVVAWVFFRSATMHEAISMLKSMAGVSAVSKMVGILTLENVTFVVALGTFALFAPNSNEFMQYHFGMRSDVPRLPARMGWRPLPRYACAIGMLLICTAVIGVSGRQRLEFLYFQF